MTRIAFIQMEPKPRFGVMYLSAMLNKHKHRCEVFIDTETKHLINDVLEYNPDIIGFSTMTTGLKFALRTARKLKEHTDALIIMGGPHPTFYPDVINEKCIDGICIGEGEYPIVDVANNIRDNKSLTKIKNIWVKQDDKIFKNDIRNLSDVNELPIADRSIYYDKYPKLRNADGRRIYLIRGCPYDCTYCFNHKLKKICKNKGSYIRFRDIDNVIDEIKFIKKKYGMKWLQIITDTINLDKKWLIEFLDRYRNEIRVPFLCNVRIDLIDEEIVSKLKEAGCNRVDFGVEHGNEEMRRKILKRNITNEQIIQNGRLFKKYRIPIQTANILGFPNETIKTAMEGIYLNREFMPDLAKCTILQPYPGTQITEYVRELGLLPNNYLYSESGDAFQMYYDTTEGKIPVKVDNPDVIVNIRLLFNYLVQYPEFENFFMWMVDRKPSRFHKLLYSLPYIFQDIKFNSSIKDKMKSLFMIPKVFIRGL